MKFIFPRSGQQLSLITLLAIVCGAALPSGSFAQTEQPPSTPTTAPLIQPEATYTVYLPMVRGGGGGGGGTPGAPVISTFTTNHTTIAPGGEATLSWTVGDATSVRIEPDVGPVTGSSVVVKPAATTTYTLIATNGTGETRATITVTVDPSQGVLGTFMEPEKKTGSPSIVIDAQGGTHLAYGYHVPIVDNPDLVYSYCPPPASSCTDPARWQRVTLGGPVDQVQIALTPNGQPRILARGDSKEKPGYKNYYYGECDGNCTNGDNWNFVAVTDTYTSGIGDVTGYYLPNRYFALDPQGRPRFVFYNGDYLDEPDRYGGYYAQCDSDCLNWQSWIVAPFTHSRPENYRYESVDKPALAFTSNGEPRVVAQLYPLDDPTNTLSGIYYFECNSGCDSDANWERIKIAERGGGPYPAWDIAVDGNDRPRIAFYKEGTLAGDDSGKRLHYLSCEGNCVSEGAWNTLNFGLAQGTGDGAHIVIDAQNRPRMAYLDASDNLGYSWCNDGCENGANWLHGTVETGSQLEAEYPVTRPITCDAGLWDTFAPTLTLDGQGNPRIVYNGSYKARCLYQDPTDPTKPPSTSFTEIWHSVRLTLFPQP